MGWRQMGHFPFSPSEHFRHTTAWPHSSNAASTRRSQHTTHSLCSSSSSSSDAPSRAVKQDETKRAAENNRTKTPVKSDPPPALLLLLLLARARRLAPAAPAPDRRRWTFRRPMPAPAGPGLPAPPRPLLLHPHSLPLPGGGGDPTGQEPTGPLCAVRHHRPPRPPGGAMATSLVVASFSSWNPRIRLHGPRSRRKAEGNRWIDRIASNPPGHQRARITH